MSGKQATMSYQKQTLKRVYSVNNNEGVKVPRCKDNSEQNVTKNKRVSITNDDVMKEVKITQEMMKNSLNSLEHLYVAIETYNNDKTEEDLEYMLYLSRSIDDIVTACTEFKYYREKQVIFCKLCFNEKEITQVKENEKPIGFIRTSGVEEPVFENDLQSRKLSYYFN